MIRIFLGGREMGPKDKLTKSQLTKFHLVIILFRYRTFVSPTSSF